MIEYTVSSEEEVREYIVQDELSSVDEQIVFNVTDNMQFYETDTFGCNLSDVVFRGVGEGCKSLVDATYICEEYGKVKFEGNLSLFSNDCFADDRFYEFVVDGCFIFNALFISYGSVSIRNSWILSLYVMDVDDFELVNCHGFNTVSNSPSFDEYAGRLKYRDSKRAEETCSYNVVIRNTNDFVIADCRFDRGGDVVKGVSVSFSEGVVRNNVVRSSELGFDFDNGVDVVFENNEFYDCDEYLLVDDKANVDIVDCPMVIVDKL